MSVPDEGNRPTGCANDDDRVDDEFDSADDGRGGTRDEFPVVR